jgi:hypothetical protein
VILSRYTFFVVLLIGALSVVSAGCSDGGDEGANSPNTTDALSDDGCQGDSCDSSAMSMLSSAGFCSASAEVTASGGATSLKAMTGPWHVSVGYSAAQGYGLLSGAAVFTDQYTTLLSFSDTPAGCGDGVLSGAEACDGADLNGQSCADQAGYASGALTCLPNCQLDLSQCVLASDALAVCGDNVLSIGEECEPPLGDGAASCAGLNYLSQDDSLLRCDSACLIDASPCRYPALQTLTAGASHACATFPYDGGTGSRWPVCWGDNSQGQAAAPNNYFSALAVGDGFSCGIVFDGSLACWGMSLQDELMNSPSANPDSRRPATRIAAGGGHMCALISASTGNEVRCFADNGPTISPPAFAPTDLTMSDDWLCVSNEESQGITSINCTNFNNSDSLTLNPSSPPTQIAVSNDMLCALVAGQIECIGSDIQPPGIPINGIPDLPYAALQGSSAGICALIYLDATQRQLTCWTRDSVDPSLISPIDAAAYPTWLTGFNFADNFSVSDGLICVSDRFTADAFCFDFPGSSPPHQAQHIAPGTRALSISTSPSPNDSAGCIVKKVGTDAQGYLSCWGDWGDLGDIADVITYDNLTSVSVSESMICVLDVAGVSYCVFRDGIPRGTSPSQPLSVIHTGSSIACGIQSADKALTCWGDPDLLAAFDPLPIGEFSDVRVMGTQGVCALTTAGELLCSPSALQPPAALASKRWASFDGASFDQPNPFSYACGVDSTGAVTCWGDGDANPTTGLKFSHVSVAYDRACGVLTDGKIRCWGAPLPGASNFDRIAPNLRSVDVGGAQTCGLRRNGEAVCIGGNELGYR